MLLAPVVAENVPAAQSPHTELCVAPVVAKYLPAAQLSQTYFPVSGLYLPAGQD